MVNDSDSQVLRGALHEQLQLSVEIGELEKQIASKREKLSELDVVIKYIQSHLPKVDASSPIVEKEENTGQENPPTEGKEEFISFIDGTIKILEDAGRALHISKIISELERRYGRKTIARNLSGNIGKDSHKRFINLGRNTWDLMSRHAPSGENNVEGNGNGVAASTTTPLFSSDNEGGNS